MSVLVMVAEPSTDLTPFTLSDTTPFLPLHPIAIPPTYMYLLT